MSISYNETLLETALANIHPKFKSKVISSYLELKRRYTTNHYNRDFDTSGLSSGKFCETILRLLQHDLTGTFTPFGKQISGFVDELNKLEQVPKNQGLESTRIIIPRALNFVYTLRNKRGIGHVGGDVEANEIDAAIIVKTVDWIVCELIRIYHNLSLEEAQTIINALSSRNIPDIWDVSGRKKILRKDLDFKQKVLLIVYSETQEDGVAVEDLFEWTEYSSKSVFKKNVLIPLHQNNLINLDTETNYVHISPLGIKEVEDKILSNGIILNS